MYVICILIQILWVFFFCESVRMQLYMTTWPFTGLSVHPEWTVLHRRSAARMRKGWTPWPFTGFTSPRVDSAARTERPCNAQGVDSPEFRRRLHESVNSARCQSIPYLLSERAYLTRTLQPPSWGLVPSPSSFRQPSFQLTSSEE